MAKSYLYLSPVDVKLVLNDLKRLGDDFKAKRVVLRRALKDAGKPIAASVKYNAGRSIHDIGKMERSFRWNSRIKKGVIYVWFQSMVKHGGYLTKIFEDGTVERFTKSGWWTGAIVEGGRRTKKIETKFIQRGFDTNKTLVESKIVSTISIYIDKFIKKSKKLNKK